MGNVWSKEVGNDIKIKNHRFILHKGETKLEQPFKGQNHWDQSFKIFPRTC